MQFCDPRFCYNNKTPNLQPLCPWELLTFDLRALLGVDWSFVAATTLTSWHLGVTYCSLHCARWLKLFEHKPFDSRTVIGFAVLNGISIGLLNLSLGFNSVGFYQVIIFSF